MSRSAAPLDNLCLEVPLQRSRLSDLVNTIDFSQIEARLLAHVHDEIHIAVDPAMTPDKAVVTVGGKVVGEVRNLEIKTVQPDRAIPRLFPYQEAAMQRFKQRDWSMGDAIQAQSRLTRDRLFSQAMTVTARDPAASDPKPKDIIDSIQKAIASMGHDAIMGYHGRPVARIALEHYAGIDAAFAEHASFLVPGQRPPRLGDAPPAELVNDFLWGPDGEWTGFLRPKCLHLADREFRRVGTTVSMDDMDVYGTPREIEFSIRFYDRGHETDDVPFMDRLRNDGFRDLYGAPRSVRFPPTAMRFATYEAYDAWAWNLYQGCRW